MNAVKDADYHALLSPSSAHTWLVCQPAIALGAAFPNKNSKYSLEGTAAHTLASDCLNLEMDATDFIGQTIDAKGTEFTVTQAFAEPVQVYVDLVRERVKSYELLGFEVFLDVEQLVPIGHITGEEGASGTSDVIIRAFNGPQAFIEVIDLKFGQGVEVSAIGNPQLMLYGAGAAHKFGDASFDEIRLTISQPRINPEPSEWSIGHAELNLWLADVARPAALNALDLYQSGRTEFELSEFTPGDKQCKFCKVRQNAGCPALDAQVQEETKMNFEVLDDMNQRPSPKYMVGALSPEQLALAYRHLDMVEGWCKSLKERVNELALSGEQLPGIKVVKGRKGSRAWTDNEYVESLCKTMRLPHAVMYNYSLASPTQLEKVASKEWPRNWKKIAAYITQADGSLQAALESDPRPAVEVKPVTELFSELE